MAVLTGDKVSIVLFGVFALILIHEIVTLYAQCYPNHLNNSYNLRLTISSLCLARIVYICSAILELYGKKKEEQVASDEVQQVLGQRQLSDDVT